eukprot:scaffold8358_cov102-Isochrysis_galbana.AAC.5
MSTLEPRPSRREAARGRTMTVPPPSTTYTMRRGREAVRGSLREGERSGHGQPAGGVARQVRGAWGTGGGRRAAQGLESLVPQDGGPGLEPSTSMELPPPNLTHT